MFVSENLYSFVQAERLFETGMLIVYDGKFRLS